MSASSNQANDKKRFLDEIGEAEGHGGFCIFREIIEHDAKYDGRLLSQVYCVNKFKWVESEHQRRDVGWAGAWSMWVESGGAKLFAEVYDAKDTAKQTWKMVIERLDSGK